MPVPINFRSDSIIAAEEARDRAAGKPPCDPGWVSDEEARSTPPAKPGDCWRITYGGEGEQQTTAGYAICCPKCGLLHYWCNASNCSSKRTLLSGGITCAHQDARTSCWTWTVDANGRPIKAVASLHSPVELGGCGYRGWLGNTEPGILSDG